MDRSAFPAAHFRCVCCAAFALILPAAPCFAQAFDAELREALTNLPHRQTKAGACVIDLDTAAVVFEYDADAPMIPASTMKVFAMATALVELGPSFSFETILATDGQHLYLIGDGDPALGDERLCAERGDSRTGVFERWADGTRSMGITHIAGDLIVDESIFEGEGFNPTWEDADLDNWYAAPVGALNFNDNCVDITLHPSKRYGGPVSHSVIPRCSIIEIVNKTKSGGKGPPVLRHYYDTFRYTISGRCPKRWPFGPASFPDPGILTADTLRTVLRNRGVTIGGKIRRARVRRVDGTLPSDLRIVGRWRTPLSDVLNRAGKNSQNLFAEALLKRSGYEWLKRKGVYDPQGSWVSGRQAVVSMAERVGLDINGLAVADGSGLSRENRCTARQMATLLRWVAAQPEWPLFCNSLSITGVDGSLRKRLKDIPGTVYGKTGTMTGVRALCGFIMAPRATSPTAGSAGASPARPRYGFSIIFNDYPGPSTPYRSIQDRICRALYRSASHETRTP